MERRYSCRRIGGATGAATFLSPNWKGDFQSPSWEARGDAFLAAHWEGLSRPDKPCGKASLSSPDDRRLDIPPSPNDPLGTANFVELAT